MVGHDEDDQQGHGLLLLLLVGWDGVVHVTCTSCIMYIIRRRPTRRVAFTLYWYSLFCCMGGDDGDGGVAGAVCGATVPIGMVRCVLDAVSFASLGWCLVILGVLRHAGEIDAHNRYSTGFERTVQSS